MEFGQEVLPQQVGGVALMEKVGELHPSWRRWAGSASPHMTSLIASRIQEAVSKVLGGGERTLDPVHNVQFVKYDVTVSFMAQVLDTVTYLVPQVLDTAS